MGAEVPGHVTAPLVVFQRCVGSRLPRPVVARSFVRRSSSFGSSLLPQSAPSWRAEVRWVSSWWLPCSVSVTGAVSPLSPGRRGRSSSLTAKARGEKLPASCVALDSPGPSRGYRTNSPLPRPRFGRSSRAAERKGRRPFLGRLAASLLGEAVR